MKLLKGLNQDVAHVDQPGGTYRRARNMIMDELAGALATENAPLYKASPIGPSDNTFQNMEICGQFKVPGDRVIVGVKAREMTGANYWDANSEELILEIDPDVSTPTYLASGPAGTFGFDAKNPFQGVGYVNAADELILVWTNGVHKPYYINATSPTAAPLLVFPEANFPMARPVNNASNDRSGKIKVGEWTFILAYEVVSGTDNLTQYGPAMGSFKVGTDANDENATIRTAIKFKMYGLDERYEYARIYAVRNFNGVETVQYADRITITGEDIQWTFTGQDRTDSEVPSTDALFIPAISYQSAETLAVSDDRLFMGNLSIDSIDYETGQGIANEIAVRWSADEIGLDSASWDNIQLLGTFGTNRAKDYTGSSWTRAVPNRSKTNELADSAVEVHSDWQGMLGGFMPDEVYALYIGFLMKDGSWSRAFHIPGGGSLGSAGNLGANHDIRVGAGTVNSVSGGQCGYVENSSEDYPNDVAFNTSLHGDLRNQPVRHHLMPTPGQLWTHADSAGVMNSDFDNEYCNSTLSLFFSNVVIPADVADQIQGFKIFYAKKNVNERRIKAYVPTWRWDFTFSTNQDFMRIYDPYLLSQQPSISGWSIKEVYKGMSYESQLGAIFATADIDDYAYLPANVDQGTFDNTNRESCLALQVSENLTRTTYNWHAGYPGFVRGQNTTLSTASSYYTLYGWHVQPKYDTQSSDYPERTAGDGLIGDNFTSTFGSYMRHVAGAGEWGYDNRPSRNNTTYGYVYYNTSASGGTYYNSVTGSSVASGNMPSGVYLGWGGTMGSFSALWEDKSDYHLNYEAQTLVATHDLVRVDGAATYTSNQMVRGGDVWITPVVVEFMAGNNPTGDPQPEDANDTTEYTRVYKTSYFTWSPVLYSKNDIQSQFTWDDLVTYSEATNNYYNGETLNDYVIGSHHFENNDSKTPFPSKLNSLDATMMPNRIIRSAKQNYESTQFAWGTFAPADYYDNALSKESIRNLEDYNGELIIHHGNGIFKTRSKFNIDASGLNVYIGTGDIFQAPPQELFPDRAGYAGLTHWSDTLLCRAGYTWIDREGKRVFLLGQGLEELSAIGMRDYFRDEFLSMSTTGMTIEGNTNTIHSSEEGGYTIGYDPVYERLMFTKRYCASQVFGVTYPEGETLSFSLRNNCWVSFHDYAPYQYFQTYSKLYFYDEIEWTDANPTTAAAAVYTDNFGALYELNGTVPGRRYDFIEAIDTGNESTSFVDVVFAMSPENAKVWQNFNWVTRHDEGEGVNDQDLNTTFDRIRVFNDTQISQWVTDFRRTDNRFQVNAFRDDVADNTGIGWFGVRSLDFQDDATILDLTKEWYERGRFVSDYITIRLEALNSAGDKLYLLDVGATARLARR